MNVSQDRFACKLQPEVGNTSSSVYQSTRRNIAENFILYRHHRENFKSRIMNTFYCKNVFA